MTAADLLARTVFYKVGHHASHNATVNEKGLELMAREDLVAAIPVDRAVALRKHPKWMMPADALYARLIEKTRAACCAPTPAGRRRTRNSRSFGNSLSAFAQPMSERNTRPLAFCSSRL